MEIVGTATKVTIYIGESDRWQRKPLYSAILELLRREGCAGATVTRAIAGFGAHSRIHSASIVRLSEDLPLVIEWIDHPRRVERIMPALVEMVAEGLITVQPVEVVTYSHRQLRELPAGTPVRDVMTGEVQAISPETSLATAVEMLIEDDYRALPVVDAERRPVGILTDGDLVRRGGLPALSLQRELTAMELGQELEALKRTGRTAQDLMTADPVTVSAQTPIGVAVRLMSEGDIKRLPVVDEQGRLAGIISRLDVLRALAQPAVKELPKQKLRPGGSRLVGDAMTRHAPSVSADAPVDEIVSLLSSTAQRRVVVVDDDRRVLGIITDGDLLKRAEPGERAGLLHALGERLAWSGSETIGLAQRTAGDIMTRRPLTVTPETPLIAALNLLLNHQLKRLPVVDEEGRLAGLIGRSQILSALSQDV